MRIREALDILETATNECKQRPIDTREVRAALDDEKNFIDHSRVASFVTTENVVVGPPTA